MARGRMLRGRIGGHSYISKVLGYGPLAYWPLSESAGGIAVDHSGNSHDGAYNGPTLGQPGIGDGNTCPLFDGAGDFVDIYSPGLRDAFDGSEGSVFIWIKVEDAAVWSENWRYPIILQADADNYVRFLKTNVNNQITMPYEAGTVLEWHASVISTTGWFQLAMTWSATADRKSVYLNGGSVQSSGTLGVWAGNLAATTAVIGAASTVPASLWRGYLAQCAIFDYALLGSQIADLAMVG